MPTEFPALALCSGLITPGSIWPTHPYWPRLENLTALLSHDQTSEVQQIKEVMNHCHTGLNPCGKGCDWPAKFQGLALGLSMVRQSESFFFGGHCLPLMEDVKYFSCHSRVYQKARWGSRELFLKNKNVKIPNTQGDTFDVTHTCDL